jgi:threonine dehydrogenase-like Zn-dependent dehydrogenase
MKKVVITGKQQAQVIDTSEPKAKDNWVVVKVHAAPMCTEYKAWMNGQPTEFLGHEAAGEVVEVAQPGKVKVGDRVVVMPVYACGTCALCIAGDYIHCEHTLDVQAFTGVHEGSATYAQYLVKPDWMLPAIPDGVTYERASLACCALGPSFGAFDTMNLNAFETVLITGLGPVGMGGVVNARYRGARVIAVESFTWRAERARQMGATVLDPRDPTTPATIKEMTDGVGVDCAIDCSGNVRAHRLCIDATRRKGMFAFVGECNEELAIRPSNDMIRKGLTIFGAWHYNLNLFPQIMQVIQHSPLLDLLVSHVMSMQDVEQAFEIQQRGEAAKVILKPWG